METNGRAPMTEEQVFDHAMDFLTNAFTARQEWLNRLTSGLDPRRDIDNECGFPKNFTSHQLHELYERDAIAARVVEVWPKECWQVNPLVYETEKDRTTPFEEAWDALGSYLRNQHGYYKKEEGSAVWEYLQRVDILSGIGQYGVLLFGIDDGLPLSEPAKSISESGSVPVEKLSEVNGRDYPTYNLVRNQEEGQRKLLYLRALPESLAQIARVESNPRSPRFGQPVSYNITLNDSRHSYGASQGVNLSTLNVHWTRVQHVADTFHQASTNDWLAHSRLEPVLNNVLSLRKLYGASAEGYWKSCFTALSFETHPSLGGRVKVDRQNLKEQYEAFINGLQRAFIAAGGSWKSIAPTVVDPTPHINVQLDAVCIKLTMPKRIFLGSERGELASGQDDDAWNDRVKGRNYSYTIPRVVCPFVERSIWLNLLPVPEQGFIVEWPDITSESLSQKMDVSVKRTTVLSQYVAGNVAQVMPPKTMYTQLLHFTDEEADAALEEAEKLAEEVEPVELPPAPGEPELEEPVENVFCATGPGGGIDATCSRSGGTGPGGSGVKASEKQANIKAAQAKVDKINKKVGEAKVKLDKLKGELKAAKGDLKAAKDSIKKGVSERVKKSDEAAKSVADKITKEMDKITVETRNHADEVDRLAAQGKTHTERYSAARERMFASAQKASDLMNSIGKTSPIKVAKAMGYKAKSSADAKAHIERATTQRVGMIIRTIA